MASGMDLFKLVLTGYDRERDRDWKMDLSDERDWIRESFTREAYVIHCVFILGFRTTAKDKI